MSDVVTRNELLAAADMLRRIGRRMGGDYRFTAGGGDWLHLKSLVAGELRGISETARSAGIEEGQQRIIEMHDAGKRFGEILSGVDRDRAEAKRHGQLEAVECVDIIQKRIGEALERAARAGRISVASHRQSDIETCQEIRQTVMALGDL